MGAGSLRIANLAFERRIKGHLPVTRLSVSDSGSVSVAVPDDHQARLYHLICFAAADQWREIGAFSVEKLQNLDFSADAAVFVAATDDDVYVFRDSGKKRFFTDRRDNYTAVSVSASGDHFVVGAADMILSSYSLILARTQGGQVWIKDLPFGVARVRISDDASRILAGSDDGSAVMLDEFRSEVWRLESSDPVTALATSPGGEVSIVGTHGGMILVIGDAGNKLWDASRDGPIVDAAMSLDGTLVAVARETAAGAGLVEFFSGDGTPVLEHAVNSRPASVACSPGGGYAAISCEDGVLQLIEITSAPGRAGTDSRAKSLREVGMADADGGEHASAVEKLTEYLKLYPGDAEACSTLSRASRALVEEHLAEAERLASEGDPVEAAKKLDAVSGLLPRDHDVFERTGEVRERLISDLLERARSLAKDGHLEEAIAKAEEAVGLDFMNCQAREALGGIEADLVAKYLADAEAGSSAGRYDDAVAILEKAVAIQPSPDVQDTLSHARAGQAFEEGLALYEAKKFSQALFQFRKALNLDPDHVEAEKYIEYAENLRQDDGLFDRFSKLE